MTLAQDEDLAHMRRAAERAGVDVKEFVPPGDEQAVLNGMRIHWLDWGTKGQRPIVFLHGGGLNAHTWDLVALALRPDYHVVAPDLRGHGDSEWSPTLDYRLETHAADVEALVRHLGLTNYVLVGMSLGGLTAIQYAGDHASALAGLVIIDIGPEFRPEGSKKVRDFLATPAEYDSIDDYIRVARAFNPLRDEVLLRRSLLHNLRQTHKGKWVWKWDPRPRAKVDLEAMVRRNAKLWASVDRITVPALVVRGGNSEIFLESDAEKLVARLPSARWLTVPNAGHTVQGDNPAGLLAALRPYLDELPGPP
jgi:esterase